jgi:hypothetical protein
MLEPQEPLTLVVVVVVVVIHMLAVKAALEL